MDAEGIRILILTINLAVFHGSLKQLGLQSDVAPLRSRNHTSWHPFIWPLFWQILPYKPRAHLSAVITTMLICANTCAAPIPLSITIDGDIVQQSISSKWVLNPCITTTDKGKETFNSDQLFGTPPHSVSRRTSGGSQIWNLLMSSVVYTLSGLLIQAAAHLNWGYRHIRTEIAPQEHRNNRNFRTFENGNTTPDHVDDTRPSPHQHRIHSHFGQFETYLLEWPCSSRFPGCDYCYYTYD